MTKTRTIKASHLWPGMILASRPWSRIYDVRPYGTDKNGEPVIEIVFLYNEGLTMLASSDIEVLDEFA